MNRDYLDPNFDPKKLNKTNLRKALASNDVQVPLSASKGELVKIFESYIDRAKNEKSSNSSTAETVVDVPSTKTNKKKKLRNKKSKAKSGLKDESPATETSVDNEEAGEEDEDLVILPSFSVEPSVPKKRNVKKEEEGEEEEEEEEKKQATNQSSDIFNESSKNNDKGAGAKKRVSKKRSSKSQTPEMESTYSAEEELPLRDHESLIISKFEDVESSSSDVNLSNFSTSLNKRKEPVLEKEELDTKQETEEEKREKRIKKRKIDLSHLKMSDAFRNQLEKSIVQVETPLAETPVEYVPKVDEKLEKLEEVKDEAGEMSSFVEVAMDDVENDTEQYMEDQQVKGKSATEPSNEPFQWKLSNSSVPILSAPNEVIEIESSPEHVPDYNERDFEKPTHESIPKMVQSKISTLANILVDEVEKTIEEPVEDAELEDGKSLDLTGKIDQVYMGTNELLGVAQQKVGGVINDTIEDGYKALESSLQTADASMHQLKSFAQSVEDEVEKTIEEPVEDAELEDGKSLDLTGKIDQVYMGTNELLGVAQQKVGGVINDTIEDGYKALESSLKTADVLMDELKSFAQSVEDEVEKTIEEPVEDIKIEDGKSLDLTGKIDQVYMGTNELLGAAQQKVGGVINDTIEDGYKALESSLKTADASMHQLKNFAQSVEDEVEKTIEEPVDSSVSENVNTIVEKKKKGTNKKPVKKHTKGMAKPVVEHVVEPLVTETKGKDSTPVFKMPESPRLSFFQKIYQEIERTIEQPNEPVVLNPVVKKKQSKVSKKKTTPHKSLVETVTHKKATGSKKGTNKIKNLQKKINLKRKICKMLHCFQTIVIFVCFLIPFLYVLWYREQQVAIGYCGHSDVQRSSDLEFKNLFGNPTDYPQVDVVENYIDSHFKPKCIPCNTETSYCFSNLEIKCKPDYINTKNYKSLYGLFPNTFAWTGDGKSDGGIYTCVKNHERDEMIEEALGKIVKLLEIKNSVIDCGLNADDLKSGLEISELKDIMMESKNPWLSDEMFNNVWDQVLENLKNEPDIIWRQV